MNQDLRRQKNQAETTSTQSSTVAPDTQDNVGSTKDSTLQRKLKALYIIDDSKPEDNAEHEAAVAAADIQVNDIDEAKRKASNALSNQGEKPSHHRTSSYEAAINEQQTPIEDTSWNCSQSSVSYHEEEVTRNPGFTQESYAEHSDSYKTQDPEEPHKHYTYDQYAVPAKGILKKSRDAPKISYSFDSYDQGRGFAISVHDQSQHQLQPGSSNQDFFSQAVSSIPQSVIPEQDEYRDTAVRTRTYTGADAKREAQMEAEMNGLYGYQPNEESEFNSRPLNPTPVHKILLESERYRNLYNASPSSKFLEESSKYLDDTSDAPDAFHSNQLRKATEQMYGTQDSVSGSRLSVRRRSPSPYLRTRSPSPQTEGSGLPTRRLREHSPSLKHASESRAFSKMNQYDSPQHGSDQPHPPVASTPSLHREDSVTSSTSSNRSSASIYERYNVPLDNALLYKTNASPQIRPQSPGGTSDTSTNVDSGFNDTFDGVAPTDGSSRTGRPTKPKSTASGAKHTKPPKGKNRMLTPSGMHILSSHKQQMDDEYAKYLQLLNQVQKQQQQRRTSAPVISDAALTGSGHQPIRAQFVKTADLYRMMQQQTRAPTPPVCKQWFQFVCGRNIYFSNVKCYFCLFFILLIQTGTAWQ